MTTEIFDTYKNIPVYVKARKDRYYDFVETYMESVSNSFDITLTPYEGLGASFTVKSGVPLVSVDGGGLPDGGVFDGAYGVLAPVGCYLAEVDGWHNYQIIGAPAVDTESGEVSGFSSGNYIQTPTTLPDVEYFDCIQKAAFNGATSEQCIWFSANERSIAMYNGKLGIYQSGWHQGETVLGAGIYWYRAIYDNGTIKLYYLQDDEEAYTLETLPEIGSWNEEAVLESCANPFNNTKVLLSRNNSSFWKGTMYLTGAQISGADGVLWTPWGKKGLVLDGVLADNVTDNGAAATHNLFYKDGKLVLDTVESKDGFLWVGSLPVTAHTVNPASKTHFEVMGNVSFIGARATFASGAMLKADKLLPDNDYTDFISRITPQHNSGYRALFSTNGLTMGTYNSQWYLYKTSKVSGGTFTIGTSYWVHIRQTSTAVTLYYMADDGTYADYNALPDVTDAAWTEAVEIKSKCMAAAEMFYIGTETANQQFDNVDLRQTVLKQGKWYFAPTEDTPPATYELYWRAIDAV